MIIFNRLLNILGIKVHYISFYSYIKIEFPKLKLVDDIIRGMVLK